jgi:hypothetical protein
MCKPQNTKENFLRKGTSIGILGGQGMGDKRELLTTTVLTAVLLSTLVS